MSTTIGEVNINLRMNVAQFKSDVQDGTEEAKKKTKDMTDAMRLQTFEARGSLMLMGEEIGVHIPRHLQRVIADLPGVGAALQAAFSSVAVLAVIEVVIKIAEKISEFRKKAEEAAKTLREVGDVSESSFHKLQEEILAVDEQLAEMNGNYLAAMLDKLKEIDASNLDQLAGEFDKIITKTQEAIKAIPNSLLDTLSTFGMNKAAIEGINRDLDYTKEQIADLSRKGLTDSVGAALEGALARVNRQLGDGKVKTLDVVQALTLERDQIVAMQKDYDLLNEKTKKQKELETGKYDAAQEGRMQAEIRAREELTNKVRALENETKVMVGGEESASDKIIAKLNEQIAKWRELDATRQAQFPGIKTIYGTEIAALERKISLIKQEDAAQQALLARGVVPGENKLGTVTAPEPKPLFNGPSAALELEKIKTDMTAANAEANRIIDSVQTQNQKFKEQVAILDLLRSKGELTQEQYKLAFRQAEQDAEKLDKTWTRFGTQISGDVTAALTFQKSWRDALTEILKDLLKVIVQMEIMKALGKSGIGGGGGGIGGFLGAAFGGFKASGGPVDASHAYMVGEHGPELFAPKNAGTIVPNHKMAELQPNVTYQHTQYITTPDADSFQKSSAQIAADAYENMTASYARNR